MMFVMFAKASGFLLSKFYFINPDDVSERLINFLCSKFYFIRQDGITERLLRNTYSCKQPSSAMAFHRARLRK